jgi:septal ring factor EnvC (AmiA/AmiB activator)
MKKVQLFLLTCSLLTLGACKTQEDIRREKVVESLNEEVQQTKKNTATGNNRFLSIEEQLAKLTGLAEEQSHQKAQLVKDNQALNERIVSLEESNKKQVEFLKALTEKVNNQSGYIEEVIALDCKVIRKTSVKKKSSKSR